MKKRHIPKAPKRSKTYHPLEYTVLEVETETIKDFVIDNHYSGICPMNCNINFALFKDNSSYSQDDIIGVAQFGPCVGREQQQFYSVDTELRRLCLLNAAPRNSESRFISLCIKWIKKHTDIEHILSLADPMQGHAGTIYKAANFKYRGTQSTGCPPMFFIDGKHIHNRTCNERFGTSSRYALKERFRERLEIVTSIPKHVYIYTIKRKHKKKPENTGCRNANNT